MDDKLSIEDLDYIEKILSEICDANHRISEKKIINRVPQYSDYPDEFNFACPICGDSQEFDNKKRGHLYLRNLRYICYNDRENDDCSFTQFCKRFGYKLDLKFKQRLYNYVDNHIKFNTNRDFKIENLNLIIKFEEFVNKYNTTVGSELSDLKPIEKDSSQYKYLVNRKIFDFENIYQANYNVYKDDEIVKKVKVIVLLNRNKDYVVGFQIRNLSDEKKYRFYKIYDFTKMFRFLYPNKKLDDLEMIAYNKLSHFYNILNIDWNKPVTVFEGYLDSIFCPNSIGMVGIENDNDLMFLLDNDEIKIRFFLDFDKKGLLKSTELIDNYPVFLWYKFFKDKINKSKNKESRLEIYKAIKDLNEAVKISNETDFYIRYKLEDYFSKDRFDKRYLKMLD